MIEWRDKEGWNKPPATPGNWVGKLILKGPHRAQIKKMFETECKNPPEGFMKGFRGGVLITVIGTENFVLMSLNRTTGRHRNTPLTICDMEDMTQAVREASDHLHSHILADEIMKD